MAQGVLPKDQNFIAALGGVSSATDTAASIRAFQYDPDTRGLTVHIVGNDVSAGDGAILDGASSSIKATVFDYTNSNPLSVRLTDTNGDYVSASGGTQYTEDAAAAANPIGTAVNLIRADSLAGITSTDGDNVAARGTDKGEMYVKHVDAIPITDNGGNLSIDDGGNTITVDGTVAVTNAGLTELAAAINASSQMDVNIAASGATVPISHSALTELAAAIDTEVQVDVVGALPAGDNNIGNVDIASIAAGDNNIGNVDLASALPAGTNAIGKLNPPDIDVTANTNYAKKYYTNAGAVTDGIVWSPAAGKRWHIHTLYINVSAAATVTLEDDKSGGDEAIWKGELAANSGVVMTFPEKYPWASGEDAADLIITTSAGNVYVTVSGYEI